MCKKQIRPTAKKKKKKGPLTTNYMKISNIWQGVVIYSELLPLSPYSVKIKGQSESFPPTSLANGWQACLVGLTSPSRAVLPSQGFSFFFFSVTASGTSRLPTCRRREAGQREGGAQSQAAWWDVGETWITPTSPFFCSYRQQNFQPFTVIETTWP